MKKLFLIIGLYLMTGCAATQMALMKHPQTGDVVQCDAPPEFAYLQAGRDQIDHCVSSYEEAGYIRVNNPK